MSEPFNEKYEVRIKSSTDDSVEMCEWQTVSPYSRYDAVHTVAGALLAGADSVTVTREETEE